MPAWISALREGGCSASKIFKYDFSKSVTSNGSVFIVSADFFL
jgi:hypothetical protein